MVKALIILINVIIIRVKHASMSSAASLIKSKNLLKWSNARYLVFDLPESKEPFEIRLSNLQKLKQQYNNNEFFQVVEQHICKGDLNCFFFLLN